MNTWRWTYIVNWFAVRFEANPDKVLDKLDTQFRVNLQKYRQFFECSTGKIIEELYNYQTMERYNNDTTDLFIYPFANIYQTKVIVSHAGTNTHYTGGDSCKQTIHFRKNKDHYGLLVVNNKQETTTTNFDDLQVVEDEISENCNITDTEW